ncbi:hypothetical protein BJX61DRAFT_538816 [Aspergillus egyptiacus]|nr:hypothetical protein BJX61DRAFT_538816 [Aspergillus egyptiacus]
MAQTHAQPTPAGDNNPELPEPETELSPEDFCIYNRLAEKMENIHISLHETWNTLKQACTSPTPATEPLTTTSLTSLALSFCDALSTHHAIEERFLFPLLAPRMSEFMPDGPLTGQHEVIHDGVVRMKGYLKRCERGEEVFERGVLGGIMQGNGFESVLWEHLDGEVWALRAERMRQVWTREEMEALRI